MLILPKFGKFLVLYLSYGCMTLINHNANDFMSPLTYGDDLKAWVQRLYTKYILKSWERSVKRNSNLSFIRVIKIHLLVNVSYVCEYMVKTFLKLFGNDFLFPAQNISLLAVQLYRVRHKMFWLLFVNLKILQTNSFSLRSFSLMYWLLVFSVH